MEWTVDKFGAKVATYGSLKSSVWNSSIGWHYSVEIWSVVCSYGTTNTEENAKKSVERAVHSVVEDIVHDMSEVTGTEYALKG